MEISDILICLFAILIAVLTVHDRVKTRKEDRAQADLTRRISTVTETILSIQSDVSKTQKQMDSTLTRVSDVQDKLVYLQSQMDEFLRSNAEVEKNFKADRRKESKALFISSIYEILSRLDRLSWHGYYRMPENKFMAREHFNWAHYETIKLKSNIYVTENKRLYDLVNELETMVNPYSSRINYIDDVDEILNEFRESFSPFNGKFQKVIREFRDKNDL